MLNEEVLLRENIEGFFKKGTMTSSVARPMAEGLFTFFRYKPAQSALIGTPP